MILELKDGNAIAPENIFDALDAVEECMGTDIREYIEVWFEGEYEMPSESEYSESVREHYISVLEFIEGQLTRMMMQKNRNQEATIQQLINLTRREINGKEDI